MLGSEYVIVLVGVSQKQLKNLPYNIIGIRRTADQKEMAQWYATADLYVNLTYCDTYPTVNVESVACRTPVLSYMTGGSSESMFGYGEVVPKGDIEAVYNAIVALAHCDRDKWTPVSVDKLDNTYYLGKYIELLLK